MNQVVEFSLEFRRDGAMIGFSVMLEVNALMRRVMRGVTYMVRYTSQVDCHIDCAGFLMMQLGIFHYG